MEKRYRWQVRNGIVDRPDEPASARDSLQSRHPSRDGAETGSILSRRRNRLGTGLILSLHALYAGTM